MEGYIKLYRQMTEWEWYKDPNTKAVFVHLLLIANHAPARWQGIDIERGQVITSIKKIAEANGLSERNVRTSLKRLKSTNEVTIKTTSKWTMITVENYERYQGLFFEGDKVSDKVSDKQVTNKRQTSDKLVTTNNNNKNNNNKKNKEKLERDKRESKKELSGNDFLAAHSRDRLPEETISETEFLETRQSSHDRFIQALKDKGLPLPLSVKGAWD